MKSTEQNLDRLNTGHLDMVFVHDVSLNPHRDEWITKFDEV
ncbi:hypothetical protein [Gracilibacillus dipsosauri]|nr:hypothetical protein [Gracilibacillus dipsosauri]